MIQKFTFLLACLSCSLMAQAQNYTDSVTMKLQAIADQSTFPGFGVALVSKDGLLYQNGFGYADQEKKTPYTVESVQNIGSITKTVLSFSLMRLVEAGKIKLDDPIDQYLPFKIVHPKFPESTITIRQLATHTSSLTDGKRNMVVEHTYIFKGNIDFKMSELPSDYRPYFKVYQQNKEMDMETFLRNTYTPEGIWYKKSNFLKTAPGTAYRYSNLGATLLAFIIEQVSGKSFAEFTREQLIQPLGINAYWKVDEVPQEKRVSLYLANDLLIPHYDAITYPDGNWFISIADFTVYLQEMIKGINGESDLLTQASYKEMMRNQLTKKNFPNGKFKKREGIMWKVNLSEDNITMNGADPGVATYTLFTTAGNVGMVIFFNSDMYDIKSRENDFRNIRGTLFQYAGKLLKQQQEGN